MSLAVPADSITHNYTDRLTISNYMLSWCQPSTTSKPCQCLSHHIWLTIYQ